MNSALTDDAVTRALIVMCALGLVVLLLFALSRLARKATNRRTLCIGLLLAAFVLEMLLVESPSLELGEQIYVNDVIVLVMAGMLLTAFTFRHMAIRGAGTVIWLGLGLLMLLSFADGVRLYGKTAGVDVRPNIYFWLAGLYCCVVTFDEDDFRRMARWCIWTTYALIAIAAYRWIGYLAGFVGLNEIAEVGAGNEFRALPSGAAFFIGAVGLVTFMAWMRGSGTPATGWHALVCAVMVVVLQHRSVWLASGIGYVFVLLQQSRHVPRRLLWLIGFFGVASASIGIAIHLGVLDRLLASLWESTISVTDPQSTATDRVFGWEALMSDWLDSSWGTVLFGYPYGTSYRRVVDRVVVEYSPHNFYLQLLLRVGVVGTSAFVLATLAGMLHALGARAGSDAEYLLLRGLGVVLLASMVYYVPYQGFYLHGAVTGLALAQLVRHRLRREAQTAEHVRHVTKVQAPRKFAPITPPARHSASKARPG